MTQVNRTVIFLILMICTFLGLWYLISPEFSRNPPKTLAATILTKPSQPMSAFTLEDTNGKPFTEKSLKGHWNVLFFGYVDCPNVCPATLTIMRDTWNHYLPTQHPPARFIFTSINPKPDSTQELSTFLKRFHPNFMGLSGKPEEIQKFSQQLGIFANPSDELLPSGALDISHTSALLVLDPQSRLRAIFTPPLDPDNIVKDLEVITRRG